MSGMLPCPVCGADFKMGQEPHDNHPVAGMFYVYHEYGPLGSTARSCPVEVREHFDSKTEAVRAWNILASSSIRSNAQKDIAE